MFELFKVSKGYQVENKAKSDRKCLMVDWKCEAKQRRLFGDITLCGFQLINCEKYGCFYFTIYLLPFRATRFAPSARKLRKNCASSDFAGTTTIRRWYVSWLIQNASRSMSNESFVIRFLIQFKYRYVDWLNDVSQSAQSD